MHNGGGERIPVAVPRSAAVTGTMVDLSSLLLNQIPHKKKDPQNHGGVVS